jgi:hypothetical protein
MQKTFVVYSDPGHGWAKVPCSLIADLGIAGDITHYSYQRNGFAYLEEDLDLYTFVKAFREANQCDPVFRERNSNNYSKIRNYAHYSLT